MSKKNLAKRLIALVAIVAMFAAMTITASAASYSSTTMYVNDETVKVTTYVTGLTKGDEVTYYAKGNNGDVYVNQYTAESASMKQSYVANDADVAGLDITMAKVSEAFDGYEKINGDGSVFVGLGFQYGETGVKYAADDALPEMDEIIVLKDVPFVDGTNYISAITATIGENAPVELDVVKVEEGGEVAFINPFGFAYDENGLIDVTGALNLADQTTVVVNLEFTYAYSPEVKDVSIDYIGVQTAAEYTVDDVTGKLFAVAYDINSGVAPSEYGIEIIDGEKLPAVGSSDEGKFAIAVVDAEFAPFKYRPYVVVDEVTYYGDIKTANIK